MGGKHLALIMNLQYEKICDDTDDAYGKRYSDDATNSLPQMYYYSSDSVDPQNLTYAHPHLNHDDKDDHEESSEDEENESSSSEEDEEEEESEHNPHPQNQDNPHPNLSHDNKDDDEVEKDDDYKPEMCLPCNSKGSSGHDMPWIQFTSHKNKIRVQ
eukprot:805820_1